MMAVWLIPNEDEYWERRREEYERVPKNWKPEPELQILSLDDELDDLEKEYGCKLEDKTGSHIWRRVRCSWMMK